jgi:hypothetical protein
MHPHGFRVCGVLPVTSVGPHMQPPSTVGSNYPVDELPEGSSAMIGLTLALSKQS